MTPVHLIVDWTSIDDHIPSMATRTKKETGITAAMKERIRIEFVNGVENDDGELEFLSVGALAEKYKAHVKRPTLYRIHKRDDWAKQRLDVAKQVSKRVDEDRILRKVRELGNLDDRSCTIALNALKYAKSRMAELEEQRKQLQSGATTEMKDVLSIAEKAQKIGKLSLGEAHDIKHITGGDEFGAEFRGVLESFMEGLESRPEGHAETSKLVEEEITSEPDRAKQ